MPQQPEFSTPTLLYASAQNCLARALYDNIAESPDELAFRRGDILVVLEQNTSNIEGWWLCSLRGRQGICPGNRLRLMAGVFDDAEEQESFLNTLQRQGKRRSWHVQPNQVLTPRKYNDVYLYDIPPRAVPVPTVYDAPPRRHLPANLPTTTTTNGDNYDVPRPTLPHYQNHHLTPSSSASSLATVDSLSSSNRSSIAANLPDYDIPKSHPQLVLFPSQQPQQQEQQQQYDVPPPVSSSLHHANALKELPLEMAVAIETLEKLAGETTAAIAKLLGFATPGWRRNKQHLAERLMDIKLSIVRLRAALTELAEFGEGAWGNATRASDKNLAARLCALTVALRNSERTMEEACGTLYEQGWSVEVLLLNSEEEASGKTDALEQIIACARNLTEDVRETACFIQGNAPLLFKRTLNAEGGGGGGDGEANDWFEDYDYVNLEIKKHKRQELNAYHAHAYKNNNSITIDPDDKRVVVFFAAQCVTYHEYLTQAIDAFLHTIEHNQPPKVFLAHGKFVVLSAHKLVHIADIVHRSIAQPELRNRMFECANALSDTLAASVTKTKQAALHFPSVNAVQEMVDSIVDISHLARDLKQWLLQIAQP